MREIKFRAWCGSFMEYRVGASQFGHFYCCPDPGDSASFFTTTYPASVPLMQFTGLHDKNGKEIYEGDVVSDGVGDSGIVEYMRTREAQFEAQGTSGDLLHFTETDIEVIGDIYQNPELLEK